MVVACSGGDLAVRLACGNEFADISEGFAVGEEARGKFFSVGPDLSVKMVRAHSGLQFALGQDAELSVLIVREG